MIINLLAPPKRKLITQEYLNVVGAYFQKLRDILFDTYADGFPGNVYNSASTYNKGDQVRYIDRSVYEALKAVPINTPPTTANIGVYWLRITNLWIGARERSKYNGNKLLLEYILNKWFDTTFRQPTTNNAAPDYYLPKSDIYISEIALENDVFTVYGSETDSSQVYSSETRITDYVINSYSFNTFAFTINIPVAVWTALGADAATRNGAVRAIADRYIIAGLTYSITTY